MHSATFCIFNLQLSAKSTCKKQLETNEATAEFIDLLKSKLEEGNVTLLYAARNPIYNHAVILKGWIQDRLSQPFMERAGR
jgi:uncharacterized protein YeaO (DUF488 family)